jgi:hypothetical protein
VSLKGFDRELQPSVVRADGIAVVRQETTEECGSGKVAMGDTLLEFIGQRRGADPEFRELGPRKLRTRIDLAADRDVRMGDDVPRLDVMRIRRK